MAANSSSEKHFRKLRAVVKGRSFQKAMSGTSWSHENLGYSFFGASVMVDKMVREEYGELFLLKYFSNVFIVLIEVWCVKMLKDRVILQPNEGACQSKTVTTRFIN